MTFDSRESSVDDGRPVELFAFSVGTTTWRYTSAPQTVVYSGNNYTPLSIKRDGLSEAQQVEKAKLKITAQRDCEVAALFLTSAPGEVVSVTVMQDHYGEGAWRVAWKGRVVGVGFAGDTVEFQCESLFSSMLRPALRRTYQMNCTHPLYSAGCGLDREDFRLDYTVGAVSGGSLSLGFTASKLPFDGADAATTFTDATGKVWTAAGNAQLDTAAYKYGTAALLLDGTGDYISTPAHGDFDLSGGRDFTLEGWVYLAASSLSQTIFSARTASGTNGGYEFAVNGSGHIAFNAWGAAGASVLAVAGTTSVTTSAWHHVAVSRQSNVVRVFLDGALEASATQSSVLVNANVAPQIGQSLRTGSLNALNGWVDDFRFTQNRAMYAAAFTPPAVATTVTEAVQADNYLAGGYVSYTDGDTGAVMRHMITENARVDGSIELATFPFALSAGDSVAVYPGCDHTLATCGSKFSNVANYGGFPYLPKLQNPFDGTRTY